MALTKRKTERRKVMDDLETQTELSLSGDVLEKLYPTSARLTIKNRLGLHARAAAKLVEAAEPFKSKLVMLKNDLEADVRSILELISLGCPYNTEVLIVADGDDAMEAIEALSSIIENRFGEL